MFSQKDVMKNRTNIMNLNLTLLWRFMSTTVLNITNWDGRQHEKWTNPKKKQHHHQSIFN